MTASKFKHSNYLEMLNEIAPELNTAHPGELHAKELPHLKVAIRIGEEKTKGFFNFNDVLKMPGSHDIKNLIKVRHNVNPDDPTNIQVR